MKTLKEIMNKLQVNNADDFYSLMKKYWDCCNNAILVYNYNTDEVRLDSVWYDAHYFPKNEGEIILARMKKPTLYDYGKEKIFTPEELKKIKRYYYGDYGRFLDKHNEINLEKRVEEVARNNFKQIWKEFYNNMEEKLMEAQKEVSND